MRLWRTQPSQSINMETLEQSTFDRLETKHRDLLQVALIKKFFKEHPTHEQQLEWVEKYGEKVSDIIDDPNNEGIRRLAREGKYEEAAALVKKILESENL